MKTLEEVLNEGTGRLMEAQIQDAKLDAWYLMEHVFHLTRSSYYMNKQKNVDEELYHQYITVVNKRASHVPLQHITGWQEFMGLPFCVNKFVLIPRQDTEILVEEVQKYCDGKTVLDMCTGSGCIILSLAKLNQLKHATGVDISEEALEVAKTNANLLEVKVELLQSDLFDKIERKYDIIVSNPPYIESYEIANLEEEVKEHEPLLALDGKKDGLFFYREIIAAAKDYLTDEGRIVFEIGFNQGNAVKKLMEAAGFIQVSIIKDLAGLDRVVSGINGGNFHV